MTRLIHDRMPVVLDKADIGAMVGIVRSAGEDPLRTWPVSRRVDKTGTGDDDPTLLDEVAASYGRGAFKPKASRGHRFPNVLCLRCESW
jgi:hypothetical protein